MGAPSRLHSDQEGRGTQRGSSTLTIMRSCSVTPPLSRSSGKGLMVTVAMAWPAPRNSSWRVMAACRSTLGLYCISSTKTARLLWRREEQLRGLGQHQPWTLLPLLSRIVDPLPALDTPAAPLKNLGDSRTFPSPLLHLHVVDPSVLLKEIQLSSAFLQRSPQLLDVTAAIVERDVTPVPDPADEEEPQGERWRTEQPVVCSPTWHTRSRCADADTDPYAAHPRATAASLFISQGKLQKSIDSSQCSQPQNSPKPCGAPDFNEDASRNKPEQKPTVI